MRALEDVRVVSLEQYGAGPFGSVHLADLGAEVIKIEDPRVGGDVGRYVPPYADEEDSLFFETFNRNKKSVSLDLSVPAGREVFEDLVRHGGRRLRHCPSPFRTSRFNMGNAVTLKVTTSIFCVNVTAFPSRK
ncbi:CoA transferase [Nonomuraea sp. MG754425]|uniref:CoA transferase n=1 Tax=Nonomuraea sp. MG754425 TaxID=2570319 RepID=UPI001F1A6049|nr:CoA transferase [Nonomuraea sp. MG754425]